MTDTAMSLDGKRVVVIGGASGIGFAVAELARCLKPGGLWVVGRTLENQTNHATFFRRTENNWEVMARIGEGSEIEKLVA